MSKLNHTNIILKENLAKTKLELYKNLLCMSFILLTFKMK
jgi:hypothetical protein